MVKFKRTMRDTASSRSFNKLLKGMPKDYASNLTLKIGNPPNMETDNYFCMWSDLLGFGTDWMKCGWNPDRSLQHKIYERLQNAHSSVLYFASPFEHAMILNDGVAKIMREDNKWWNSKTGIQEFSLFFRSCIQLHLSINEVEESHGYPGTRSVFAYGVGIRYLAEEVSFDDFVFNYTKPKGSEICSTAQQNGNPVVVYNPKELQMNSTFSKAYIIESIGSSQNIEGNKFYIDQSALDAIDKLARNGGFKPVVENNGSNTTLLYPYEDDLDRVLLGLELSSPIEIRYGNIPDKWNTTVYRILKYYPFDEKRNEFVFEL